MTLFLICMQFKKKERKKNQWGKSIICTDAVGGGGVTSRLDLAHSLLLRKVNSFSKNGLSNSLIGRYI